jgi:hypothetical protein
MRLPVSKHLYVPAGGDPSKPVEVLGWQNYSPGRGRRVDGYVIIVPEGVATAPPESEVDSWAEVTRRLCVWFPEETAETLRSRLVLKPWT